MVQLFKYFRVTFGTKIRRTADYNPNQLLDFTVTFDGSSNVFQAIDCDKQLLFNCMNMQIETFSKVRVVI